MGLLQEVDLEVERAEFVRTPAVVPHAAAASRVATSTRSAASIGSWRKRRPVSRKRSGSPVVRKRYIALAGLDVLDAFPRECLGHLAGRLLGREDERHAAPEHALEDRADERIVRAAEDHGVHVLGLQDVGVLANRCRGLLPERIVALDQRDELRAGNGEHLHARVERAHEVPVAPARDRRLGGEEPDASVARREDRSMGLGRDDADHGHGELPLEVRERRCGRRVARDEDQLDSLPLEEAPDLEREAADLVERAWPVRQPGAVSEVDEVLVREGDEALVQDGQAAHARVEDADRSRIHRQESRPSPGRSRRTGRFSGSGVPFDLVVKFVLAGLAAALLLVVGEAPAAPFAKQDVAIPMDDGVSIAATLYLPDGSPPAGGWPAIVFLHGLARKPAAA